MIAIKNINRLLLLAASFVAFSCSDYEDDRLSFDEPSPLYVKFTSVTKKTLVEGKTLTVQVETPLFTYKPLTVNYEVTGDYATTGSVVIPAGKKTATFDIVAPNDEAVSATKQSTVTITSVSDGLTVGRTGLSTSFALDIVDDAKKAGFSTDSTGGYETDSWVYAVISLTNPAAAETTVNYSITGGVLNVSYTDPDAGVLKIKSGASADTIRLKLLDNVLIDDPSITLEITINSITTANSNTETTLDPDAKTFKYTILDDLKFIGVGDEDIVLEDLKEADYSGVHAFPITLTGSTDEVVTVNYSISGAGVTDLSGGSLKFFPNASDTQEIVVEFTSGAFASDQTVVITLISIVSDDEEVVFNTNDLSQPIGTKISLGLTQ